MQNTLVIPSTTEAAQLDLFGLPVLPTSRVNASTEAIVTKAGRTTGVRIKFDAQSFAEFKKELSTSSLTAEQKKLQRQQFLSADNVERRKMLGRLALEHAFKPDAYAPLGRVPDVMELKKAGTLKLISVADALGVKPESVVKQQLDTAQAEVARLTALLAEKEAKEKAIEADASVITEAPAAE